MECREFNAILADVLVRERMPPAALRHLDECAGCAAMLNDFETIADRVRSLALEESATVPDRWPQIREALQREGIIHAAGAECAPEPASRPQPQLVKPRLK